MTLTPKPVNLIFDEDNLQRVARIIDVVCPIGGHAGGKSSRDYLADIARELFNAEPTMPNTYLTIRGAVLVVKKYDETQHSKNVHVRAYIDPVRLEEFFAKPSIKIENEPEQSAVIASLERRLDALEEGIRMHVEAFLPLGEKEPRKPPGSITALAERFDMRYLGCSFHRVTPKTGMIGYGYVGKIPEAMAFRDDLLKYGYEIDEWIVGGA